MRDLARKVRNRISMLLTGETLIERHIVLGHELQVNRGVVRSGADYDDAWLHACAQHYTVALDLGCNIGQASILMLLSNTIKRIVLVDANAQALSMAARNLIRNELADTTIYVHAFVSDSADQTQDFWTVGTGAAGSAFRSHAVTASARNEHVEVSTTTVDKLCERLCIQPDLCKVDVEGAEFQVLVGAAKTAQKQNTRFFVEMHANPDLPMTQNAQQVLKWCSEVNYLAWYLSEHRQLETADQIAHRGRCHLLLQPNSWPFPDWLRHINQSDPLGVVIS